MFAECTIQSDIKKAEKQSLDLDYLRSTGPVQGISEIMNVTPGPIWPKVANLDQKPLQGVCVWGGWGGRGVGVG